MEDHEQQPQQRYFVRALTSGPWRKIDIVDGGGRKLGEKTLVQSLQITGRWCVDRQPVEVWFNPFLNAGHGAGLAVSFRDEIDAEFFLDQGRAAYVAVEPGMIVVFHSAEDAGFFVRNGLGELLGEAEVRDLMLALQQAVEAQERQVSGEAAGEIGDENAVESEAEADNGKQPRQRGGKRGAGSKRKAA